MFPNAGVSGRLRPDVYGDGNGLVARDSAGTRVVVQDAAALDRAALSIHRAFRVTAVRDHRCGRRATPYYRALHLYVEINRVEVELQLRTRRHHRLAQWAHERVFLPCESSELVGCPDVDRWLVAVADAFDCLDQGQEVALPPAPPVLHPHLPALGLAPHSDWAPTVPSTLPLLSHATKDLRCLEAILAEGALMCPRELPAWVPRFSGFADQWAGRTSVVMLSPGFGYVVDNANMCAAFLFSEDLIRRPEVTLHRQPEVFAISALVLATIRDYQREHWLRFFRNPSRELACFNHPLVAVSFRDYMLYQLTVPEAPLAWRDAWGPSTFSEGVLRLLYLENAALRSEVDRQVAAFRSRNRIGGGSRTVDLVRQAWQAPSFYKTPEATPLSDDRKNHLQVLVPNRLVLGAGECIGLCVAPRYAVRVVELLQKYRVEVRALLGAELPVYCGGRVAPLARLIDGPTHTRPTAARPPQPGQRSG
jgi:hypothetical protein